jgi:hypothetical protein
MKEQPVTSSPDETEMNAQQCTDGNEKGGDGTSPPFTSTTVVAGKTYHDLKVSRDLYTLLFIAIHEAQTECLCVRYDNKRIMSHTVPRTGIMKISLRTRPVGFVRSELTSELILSGLLHRIHGLIYVDNRHDEEEIMQAERVAHGDEDERSISGLLCQLLKLDRLPKQSPSALDSAGFVLTARHAFRILEIAALRMHGSGGELEAAACALQDRVQLEEIDEDDANKEDSNELSVLEMLGQSEERDNKGPLNQPTNRATRTTNRTTNPPSNRTVSSTSYKQHSPSTLVETDETNPLADSVFGRSKSYSGRTGPR